MRIEINTDKLSVDQETPLKSLKGEALFSNSGAAMLHLAQVIEQLKKETADLFVNVVIEVSKFKYDLVTTEKKQDTALLPENLLSKREKEVLTLVFDGLTNKEIAGKLFISFETVKSHRKNILNKTESKNTAALMRKINPSEI